MREATSNVRQPAGGAPEFSSAKPRRGMAVVAEIARPAPRNERRSIVSLPLEAKKPGNHARQNGTTGGIRSSVGFGGGHADRGLLHRRAGDLVVDHHALVVAV